MKIVLLLVSGMVLMLSGKTNFPLTTADAPLAGNDISECRTLVYSPEARAFVSTTTAPMAAPIRKNVYALTTAEINAIKAGISAMKALPVTNKTSWQYQAAIHGTTLAGSQPSWNSCQHGNDFFLSWHRMYLYFFERILRAKSGAPNLTLPYWNYQANPALPPAYRDNTAGNPLFDNTRAASINSGGSLSSGIMTAITNALNDNISFFDFSSDLEGPHGSVHVAVGGSSGNMRSVNRAALDPCFWLHHANVDRLWVEWLRKCGGRSNPPANSPWMNQQFTFFDENGAAVVMTGSQIINTASSLNYQYDFPFKLPCNFFVDWWKWKFERVRLLRFEEPIRISQATKVPFSRAKAAGMEDFVRNKQNEKFNFSASGISDKVFVELENVKVERFPEGTVEVYMNLPANEQPTPRNKFFAGVVDLFTATAHQGHQQQTPIRVNITAVVRNLNLSARDLKQAELTFYVRGNTLRNEEKKTNSAIQINALNFVVHKAQRTQ